MIAPDANLLIYAFNTSAPEHCASRKWLEDLLSGDEPVGIPNIAAYALIRFVTNAKLLPKPISFQRATEVIDRLIEPPHVSLLYPGACHWSLLSKLAVGSRIQGAAITDRCYRRHRYGASGGPSQQGP